VGSIKILDNVGGGFSLFLFWVWNDREKTLGVAGFVLKTRIPSDVFISFFFTSFFFVGMGAYTDWFWGASWCWEGSIKILGSVGGGFSLFLFWISMIERKLAGAGFSLKTRIPSDVFISFFLFREWEPTLIGFGGELVCGIRFQKAHSFRCLYTLFFYYSLGEDEDFSLFDGSGCRGWEGSIKIMGSVGGGFSLFLFWISMIERILAGWVWLKNTHSFGCLYTLFFFILWERRSTSLFFVILL